MKKILTSIFIVSLSFITNLNYAQSVQASIGAGSSPNSVIIYLKSDVTQTPATLSTLQFNIGIPITALPIPTATITTNNLGQTYTVSIPYIEGNYLNYNISTSASPIQPNLTANTEFAALEVSFDGGPVAPQDVSLVCLPDGGLITNAALFYCTGTLTSDGSNLYFARLNTTVNNQMSYDEPDFGNPGTGTSTATVAGITLPLTWLNFSAQKQNGNALVKWDVANQLNNDYFEVQVSNDGRSFSTIGKVYATDNTSYSFTDPNLYKLQGSYAHYRIKQVDKDGKASYSDIRKLLITGKDFAFTVVGNPVTGSQLSIGIQSPENSKGVITILDLNGKKVFMKNITWSSGYSQQSLSIPFLAGGTYTANLITASGQFQVKFVK